MADNRNLKDCLSFITESVQEGLKDVPPTEPSIEPTSTLKLARMVIELYKESLTSVDRVNPDKSLAVLAEIVKAITTAKIMETPLDELYLLKADVELIRNLND